jgi:lipopolysaccharide export LptBFGC system permease protein LptF
MEKSGVSNVEMVLAFLIFIGAVLFTVYFLNNQINKSGKSDSIDYIYNKISEVSSENVETYSIKLNNQNLNLFGLDLGKDFSFDEGIGVYTLAGSKVPISLSGNIIYLDANNINDIFFVRISKSISANYTLFDSLPPVNSTYYEIASRTQEKLLSEKILEELKRKYEQDYDKLKTYLGISRDLNFGLNVVFSPFDFINLEKDISKQAEVFSNKKRIEIIRKDGSTAFADVQIKVW